MTPQDQPGEPPAATPTAVVIEADGGSRGNPGRAAYGSVLKDAVTGETLAEQAEEIGVETNNVAEYRGLIGGLELAAELAPQAAVEVRMDSKLVIEQMAGRWKVKHPSMRPLALRAQRLVPPATTWTWVPREQNKHADRILNEVLDGKREQGTRVLAAGGATRAAGAAGDIADDEPVTRAATLVLLTHAGTPGRRGSGLDADGRARARALAEWLVPTADDVALVAASPAGPAARTAGAVAERLGLTPDAVREVPWLEGADVVPAAGVKPGDARRLLGALDALVTEPGVAARTVVAVTHAVPVALAVADALGAPPSGAAALALPPASLTVLALDAGTGRRTVRVVGATAPASAAVDAEQGDPSLF